MSRFAGALPLSPIHFPSDVKDSSVLTVNIEGASEPRTVVAFDSGVFKETVNGIISDNGNMNF